MDYETKSEVIITKAQTRDEFLQLLIDNLTTYAIYLDKNEKKLFFNILDRMNYQGIVITGTSFKGCVKGYMSKSSFYRSLKGLLEKEVIYEFNDKLAKKFNIGSYFKNFF
ncbi:MULTISPECIES: hypothetical protein [unclassified Campylobacter]|uniref:hypothetical protein n=1 Tax=unclassified Campylobacter TaxID=2593542 RepID=UPI00123802CD|nr:MULTISPECIES: hypothetical protein [unclassified Campylobacter]KAA6224671.1 hypothetical protein FMM54_07430 [Campylobacter sp. LR185c]KAA6225671.1 hypothetical protein FMM57_07225 [Campylobacter sp. LR286c]KAA6225790.1 hypothetical protein FMM55_05890 [Campylobacter sp. LR196d]KAA6229644.1 hypothetical protein FMM58_06980 [Campylobacter sp. LR291e]KAA6230111.1 hypothetical protein FMM56_06810 [Campylobacter sp. LR264d]